MLADGGVECLRNVGLSRKRKEEWKDGEEVNEESDAPGRLPLVPDIQMHTHART